MFCTRKLVLFIFCWLLDYPTPHTCLLYIVTMGFYWLIVKSNNKYDNEWSLETEFAWLSKEKLLYFFSSCLEYINEQFNSFTGNPSFQQNTPEYWPSSQSMLLLVQNLMSEITWLSFFHSLEQLLFCEKKFFLKCQNFTQ